MAMDLNTIIQIVQAVSGLATVATLLFLWWQVRAANQQRELDYHKSGIEFFLNVGGQGDGIYEALLHAPSHLIRSLYRDEVDQDWSDEQIKEYWFCRRMLGHIARMAYIVGESSNRFGMSTLQAEGFLELWLGELRKRAQVSPMMKRCLQNAIEQSNWNKHIQRYSKRILEEIV